MLYTETVLAPSEVLIHGQRYPLFGTVRRQSVTPFPGKMTVGDYGREDHVVVSEWVVSDFSGGLGIRHARPNRDDDRCEIGDLEARYRFLTLPPEVVKAGTLAGPIDQFVEYNSRLYAVKAPNVYWWDAGPKTWQTLQVGSPLVTATLSGAFRDAAVHDGKLYILTATTLYAFDAAAAAPNDWTSQAVGGYALASFDDKLWRLDTTNAMQWALSSAPTVWTAAGRLLLPVGHCRQLIVFWDQSGLPALHAITRTGVAGYDPDTQKFYPTPLVHPPLDSAGRGAAVWQGALWVPAGAGVYRYSGNLVQASGPDKDDGLPPQLHGTVRQMVAGHGFLWAVINAPAASASSSGASAQETGFLEPTSFFPAVTTNGAVLSTPGAAWHLLRQELGISSMGAALVASVDTTHRLWYSTAAGIYYTELPLGLHNPLANPATRYAASGFLDTPWQDMRWAEVDKQALSLDIEAEGCTATETIRVSLGWDGDPTWELIGTITTPGRSLFEVGGLTGKRFRTVRMRIEMSRGSTVTKTPVLRSASLGYMRVPPAYDGWQMTLDLTEPRCSDTLGQPAPDVIAQLFDLKRTRRAMTFTYRIAGAEPSTRKVWLHEISGSDLTGEEVGGRYTVFLLELDRSD